MICLRSKLLHVKGNYAKQSLKIMRREPTSYLKENRLTLGLHLALTRLLRSSERVGFTSPKSHLSIFIYVEQRYQEDTFFSLIARPVCFFSYLNFFFLQTMNQLTRQGHFHEFPNAKRHQMLKQIKGTKNYKSIQPLFLGP